MDLSKVGCPQISLGLCPQPFLRATDFSVVYNVGYCPRWGANTYICNVYIQYNIQYALYSIIHVLCCDVM